MAQLILFLKERELSRHPLLSSTVRIGRDPTNEIVIDNVGVSRHHATVYFDGSGFFVRDEGSQNGSYVGGQRIQHQALHEGDVLQLGKFSLQLVETTQAASPSAAPAQSRSLAASRRGRDPQSTMALGAEEVAKLLAQLPGEAPGPETRREPPPPAADVEAEPEAGPPLIWIGLGLLVLIIAVAAAVFRR